MGSSRSHADCDSGDVFAVGSLLCPDGLLDCRCGRDERTALIDMLNALPMHGFKFLFIDRPSDYDGDEEIDRKLGFPVHAQDPLHIALRVERASGNKKTELSRKVRRIMLPLGLHADDGRPVYRKHGRELSSQSLLPNALASMTQHQPECSTAEPRRSGVCKDRLLV